MHVTEFCSNCLYEKQLKLTDNPDYLKEVRALLDVRKEGDSAPYMTWLFDKIYARYFGKTDGFQEVKKEYNDLVLSMEAELRQEVLSKEDPLKALIAISRIGNYIDFGTLNKVDRETFLGLFSDTELSEADEETYRSFLSQLEKAERFLLLADNCGEIVLDKLLIEYIKEKYPGIQASVMVRGSEVLNDVTREDAAYVGIDQIADIVDTGNSVGGVVYKMLAPEAKRCFDEADVILAKGMGNYECLSEQNHHVFYLFLCKCERFMEHFKVPKLTGLFIEEV